MLASFASLVGVLGIRISAELKTVPSGVASWIIGLLAWASAALLGTGILRIDIAPEYLDLLVGGLWLGGVLAVFQAVSLYLRTTYIQAQKRFLQRSGCELSPIQWGMPKVGSGSKNRDARTRDNNADAEAEELQDESHKSRRWKMPWKKSRTSEGEELLQDEEDLDSDARETKGTDAKPKPGKLFGLIPNRQMRNETLEDEPVGEDDGGEVDEGLKKTQGWFGIGGNKAKDNEDSSTRKSERSEQPNKRKLWSRKPKDDADELGEESRDSNAEGAPRKKLGLPKWPTRTKASATAPPPDHSTSQAEPGAKKKWGTGLSSFRKNKPEGSDASPDEVSKDKTSKGKMFGLRKNKSEEAPGTNSSADTAEKPTKSSRLFGAGKKAAKNEPTETKPKKGWFGFINDMKLKPPPDIDDELGERNNTTRAEARKPSPPVQAPPVPKAAATATPVPIKSSAPVPSTSSYDEDDDDEDGEYGSRPLSKSERKRLKKQQDRRAG